MADAAGRFCANPPQNEGLWRIFYQAPEDINWRAISLTHVNYPAGKFMVSAVSIRPRSSSIFESMPGLVEHGLLLA